MMVVGKNGKVEASAAMGDYDARMRQVPSGERE
jgi:hypothetical protein